MAKTSETSGSRSEAAARKRQRSDEPSDGQGAPRKQSKVRPVDEDDEGDDEYEDAEYEAEDDEDIEEEDEGDEEHGHGDLHGGQLELDSDMDHEHSDHHTNADPSDEPSHSSPSDSDGSEMESIDSGSEIGGKEKKARKGQTKREILLAGFDAFDSEEEEIKTIAMDAPSKLARSSKKSRQWIKKKNPALGQAQLLSMVPKAEDYSAKGWTDEMEEEFLAKVQDHPEIRFIRDHAKLAKTNNKFLAMWKKICRLNKVYPTDIISRSHNLKYAATPDQQFEGKFYPDPFWTQRFCEYFTKLSIGGPWFGNMNLLSCVIIYAKACQLNDRRQIKWEHNSTCAFMDRMEERLGTTDGTKSIRRIHKEVREEFTAQGKHLPPYSMLLRYIEKKFFKSTVLPYLPEGEGDFLPYSVGTEDLRDLSRIIRSVKDVGGLPYWPSLKEKADLISSSRASHDQPNTEGAVKELIRRHLISDWRKMEIRKLSFTSSEESEFEGFDDVDSPSDSTALTTASNIGAEPDLDDSDGVPGSSDTDSGVPTLRPLTLKQATWLYSDWS